MYHEISETSTWHGEKYYQTPTYDISVKLFESQIKAISENGFISLDFKDVLELKNDGKYIILTFDDGLKGNHSYALPILKKYGFKAVFFVTVGSIGLDRFMNWEDLIDLIENGMSIQSHTVSHRPLQTLNEEDIYFELAESKRILESRLESPVSAISFPHGSFNRKILRLAEQVGYETMCYSYPERLYLSDIKRKPSLQGRIAMTNRLTLAQLMNITQYKKLEMIKLKVPKIAKNFIKKAIGINAYRYFYRRFFNIKSPSQTEF